MLKKVQFDEYSATVSQRFCCRTCPWQHVQQSGFTLAATLIRSVVFCLSGKRRRKCRRCFTRRHGSEIMRKINNYPKFLMGKYSSYSVREYAHRKFYRLQLSLRMSSTGRSHTQNFLKVQYIIIQAVLSRRLVKKLQLPMKKYSMYIRLLTVK